MITIASCITLLRIILAPVVVQLILQHSWTMATIIFVFAAATDLVDGYVARRFGQESKLGKLLDPLADKILLMSTLYSLLYVVSLQPWQMVLVYFLLAKEITLLVGAAILKLRYNYFIEPSLLSRMVSLLEIMLIVLLLGSMTLWGTVPYHMVSVLLMINVMVSVWLLVRYGRIVKGI